nr:MAG TPA: hypothetical protein [Caudoviricetes sp.]
MILNFCAVRQCKLDVDFAAERFPDALPFFHGKFPGIQSFVKQLRGPSEASRQLGVCNPKIRKFHFDYLPRCHGITSFC